MTTLGVRAGCPTFYRCVETEAQRWSGFSHLMKSRLASKENRLPDFQTCTPSMC